MADMVTTGGVLHMTRNERLSRRKFLSFSLASAGAIGIGVAIKPQQAHAAKKTTGTTVFVDGLGRSVRIPIVIESVTPTGISAQTMLCELCPEKMASLAVGISEADAADYQDAQHGRPGRAPRDGDPALHKRCRHRL
jgi:hypothetical protein